MSFFNELKRRNVFRVGIAYVVVAWLVMQVADVILNNITAPGWVFHVILLLLGIGFLLAMFFAWAFEMTPEGLKRESDVDRSQSITPQTGKKLNLTITVVMALALGYFAYDKFVVSAGRESAAIESAVEEATSQVLTERVATQETTAESDNSIAVLPFVNMSSDAEQDYFSDGLSEELLNLLAKIPELRVIARTSSFAYKGKDIQIADVARELNVDHVLEGSVRKAGSQVRITAQLIRGSDSSHLWSETYDRSLDNIFAIQDEIAAEVVKQLKVTLLGTVPTVQETDSETFALYLQARHLSRLGSAEGYQHAIALYKQMLTNNPDYAQAWADLGLNYLNETTNGLREKKEGYQLATEALNKALTINPDNVSALSRLAFLGVAQSGDLVNAAQLHERALSLEPSNDIAISNAANYLNNLGRVDEAIKFEEFALNLDPVNSTGLINLGARYLAVGRLDEAMGLFRRVMALSPGRVSIQYYVGKTLLLQDEPEAALAAFFEETEEEYRTQGTALAQYTLGNEVEHQAALAELQERWGTVWPADVAAAYAWAGDADAAFDWLERELQINGQLYEIVTEPLLVSLHDDPRWQPLLEKAGASTAQLAAIEFNVTLPK